MSINSDLTLKTPLVICGCGKHSEYSKPLSFPPSHLFKKKRVTYLNVIKDTDKSALNNNDFKTKTMLIYQKNSLFKISNTLILKATVNFLL